MRTAIPPRVPDKTYRICPECPFFCRTEELIVRCPWCRVRLLSRCGCGEEIADPAASECARCGSARRLAVESAPALSPHS